ncbi:MAG: hypothetical protein COA58_10490 [Bacteroidetes bacterium]|nr:MAG: hypothetical protein COA58_10490 [Bacteroidota bacterium]
MENNIKQEWKDITSNIDSKPQNVSNFIQKDTRPDWIKSNIIELVITIAMVLFLGIYIFSFDDKGVMPLWTKYLLVFSSILPLWPIFNLYKRINYPDHSQSTIEFLKSLIKHINRYRTFQILYNTIFAFGVCFIILIHLEAITATLNGVKYAGIVTFPDEIKYPFMKTVALVSFVISLISSPMPIVFYQIFYAKMRKEAKGRLKELLEE